MLVSGLLLSLLNVYGDKIKDPHFEVLYFLDLIGHLLGLVFDDLVGGESGTRQFCSGHSILLLFLLIIHKEEGLQLIARDQNIGLYFIELDRMLNLRRP